MRQRRQHAITRQMRTGPAVKVVTTSLALPEALRGRATKAAEQLHWSLAELIRTALVEYLDAHDAKARRASR